MSAIMMEGKIAQVKSRHFGGCACRVPEGQESLPLHKMGQAIPDQPDRADLRKTLFAKMVTGSVWMARMVLQEC